MRLGAQWATGQDTRSAASRRLVGYFLQWRLYTLYVRPAPSAAPGCPVGGLSVDCSIVAFHDNRASCAVEPASCSAARAAAFEDRTSCMTVSSSSSSVSTLVSRGLGLCVVGAIPRRRSLVIVTRLGVTVRVAAG